MRPSGIIVGSGNDLSSIADMLNPWLASSAWFSQAPGFLKLHQASIHGDRMTMLSGDRAE